MIVNARLTDSDIVLILFSLEDRSYPSVSPSESTRMAREKFEATDDSTSVAHESRQLVGIIFSYANYENDDLRAVCTRLHNSGVIDLLALVHTSEFELVNRQEFFAGQKFYCDVLPKLQASVIAVMNCIKALVGKAGNDLAANFPHEAFKKWCEADLLRAREIVDLARSDEESAKEFLTVALIAGNYSHDAKEFARNYRDTRRLSGVFSLGKIKYESLVHANCALALFSEIVSGGADEILCANVLSASFDVVNNFPSVDREKLFYIATRICEHPYPAVLDACAQVLLRYPNQLSDDLVGSLFDALKALPPTQKGSLETLDYALSLLIGGNHATTATNFLKEYLPSQREHLALSNFKSFQSALTNNPAQLQKTLVSWMLTAEAVLCEGIAALFRNGEDEPFNFDVSVSHLSTADQIFLCRKVVGYLFTQATVACSFLVCILGQCNDVVAEAIGELLFDPILRSYAGKARAYLSSIPTEDKIFPRIEPALTKAEIYLSDINSIGEIKELHPSESARQAISLRDFDEMQDAHKEAEKNSVLLSMVTRSVVLHGQRTLTYFEDEDRGREPMEMELHAHSIGFEMPRQDVLDPIGIDYIVRVLRAERRKS